MLMSRKQWDVRADVRVKGAPSCPTLCDPMDYTPWNSPGQNTGAGSLSLLQGIFLTQGLNRGLLHCRRILYQLSYEGSPKWVLLLLLLLLVLLSRFSRVRLCVTP